jgi:hypothetical protein
VEKSEGGRPLGTPRHRWEDKIEMYLKEIGWGGMDWINVSCNRDKWWAGVNTVINLWFL